MLTDPAVPMRAVAGTLGARICLDSLFLVRLAFLPTIGSLKHLAACRNDLLIRRQFCVINHSKQVINFVERPTLHRPSSLSSSAIVNLKSEGMGDGGNCVRNVYHILCENFHGRKGRGYVMETSPESHVAL